MHIEFTQADESHLPSIVALVNASYRGESSKKGWTTEADLLDGQRTDEKSLLECLKSPDSVILIAEDENNQDKLVGCVHLQKHGDRCYLGMLTVSPEIQSQGIGKMLISEAEAFCQFWDCTHIFMTVITARTELIAWYLKLGFKDTKELQKFPYGDERFGIPKRSDLVFTTLEKRV